MIPNSLINIIFYSDAYIQCSGFSIVLYSLEWLVIFQFKYKEIQDKYFMIGAVLLLLNYFSSVTIT